MKPLKLKVTDIKENASISDLKKLVKSTRAMLKGIWPKDVVQGLKEITRVVPLQIKRLQRLQKRKSK